MTDDEFNEWLERMPTTADGGVHGLPRRRIFKADIIAYLAERDARVRQEAKAEEQERCAQVADKGAEEWPGMRRCFQEVAAAIRALGEES